MIYSAKDQQLHAFSVNGELLVSLRLRLWDPLRGGRSAVRALLMTQSCTPGVVVVVEDGGFAVRRSHDLSLCTSVKCTAGSAISCATMREAGGERYEIVAGLENGRVVVWVVDLREQLVTKGDDESSTPGDGRPQPS